MQKLSVSSAAAIIHNNGFEYVHSGSLNLINCLMIKYFEALCRDGKNLAEQNLNENGIEEIIPIENGINILNKWINLDDLADYIKQVEKFPPFYLLPQLPIAVDEFEKDEKIHFTTFGFTTMQLEKEDFPSYANCSAADLGFQQSVMSMSNQCSSKTFANESLDSLSSPILAILRPRFPRKRLNPTSGNPNLIIDKDIKLKAVRSKTGIKLRLMNEMENTPPGYISTRSQKVKVTNK